MLYLISQFGWYLLAAFVIGLVTGWITCDRERRQWGWLPFGLLAAFIAFLLTWFRVINGVPALWVETALLMFALFLIGCCIGCMIKQVFVPIEAGGVRDWNENRGAPGPGIGTVPVTPSIRDWHADLTSPATAQPVMAVAAPPVVPSAATMPEVEGENLIAGSRPPGLISPRDGKADDLKLIRGIGKQNEGRLHGLGVWHFDQIASWTKDNALWIGSYLAFPGRIEREEWIAQAKDLAAGKETDFAVRVKRGEVSSSKDDGSRGQSNVFKKDGQD